MLKVLPRDNLAANTDRGPSPNIWFDCPVQEFLQDPGAGQYFFDDFNRAPSDLDSSSGVATGHWNGWDIYQYTGATLVNANILGGGITIASDGDNEGVALLPGLGSFKITGGSSPTGKLWFEVRLKSSTIADTKHGIFAGLIEGGAVAAAVPLAADGTLADKNMIGFWRVEGDGDQLDFAYKADGQSTQQPLTDPISGGLVADTFIKLGFIYDPFAPDAYKITVFINGVKKATYVTETNITAATFPSDITLGPVLAVMNATGTTPGSTTIDWIRVAQKF